MLVPLIWKLLGSVGRARAGAKLNIDCQKDYVVTEEVMLNLVTYIVKTG